MDTDDGHEPLPIERTERAWLRLVFGGPVKLWVPLARLVGVRVEHVGEIDEALLARAEAGAIEAARRFPAGLLAATAGVVGVIAWLPIQSGLLESYTHGWFHMFVYRLTEGGAPFWLAMALASAMLMGVGAATGLANAVVFGALPLLVLRRCTLVAAPAVSIAIAQGDAATEGLQALAYPRVAYAAERILYPRGRTHG
ncbi:MAG: hypothetical protein JW733_07390 [Coriobacteriia bacterium]|nr:hypothetical protein [Coriobacteriia bacterium]